MLSLALQPDLIIFESYLAVRPNAIGCGSTAILKDIKFGVILFIFVLHLKKIYHNLNIYKKKKTQIYVLDHIRNHLLLLRTLII